MGYEQVQRQFTSITTSSADTTHDLQSAVVPSNEAWQVALVRVVSKNSNNCDVQLLHHDGSVAHEEWGTMNLRGMKALQIEGPIHLIPTDKLQLKVLNPAAASISLKAIITYVRQT